MADGGGPLAVDGGGVGVARHGLVTDHGGTDADDQVGRNDPTLSNEVLDHLGLAGGKPVLDCRGQDRSLAYSGQHGHRLQITRVEPTVERLARLVGAAIDLESHRLSSRLRVGVNHGGRLEVVCGPALIDGRTELLELESIAPMADRAFNSGQLATDLALFRTDSERGPRHLAVAVTNPASTFDGGFDRELVLQKHLDPHCPASGTFETNQDCTPLGMQVLLVCMDRHGLIGAALVARYSAP